MTVKHYDIIIIGAGLSGIGTACHIAREHPGKSLAILERRENVGGTWDLFRYPGIRSDSDMASFGFNFKPWYSDNVLAQGGDIREYVRETAEAFGLYEKIKFGLKLKNSDWSTKDQKWTVSSVQEASGEEKVFTCNFLVNCAGYYNFDQGYRPAFPDEEVYTGDIVHPQRLPEDFDYSGKKVVVIGSGATAITLVPAMADKAAKVTMLQRSPSYIMSLPNTDKISMVLNKLLPKAWVFKLARRRNILFQRALYLACQRWPNAMRKMFLSHMYKHAPNVDKRHLTPEYMPWDQRLCAAPDGDFFESLRSGKAELVTDHIDRFDETGIVLKSGQHIEADIVVAATGLEVQLMGGSTLSIDSEEVNLPKKMAYKGILIQDVPNYGWIFGYTNAPWTLKCDIGGRYLCRLFAHMNQTGVSVATAVDTGNNATNASVLDGFAPGYIVRAIDKMPRQGKADPWRITMHYGKDKKMLVQDPVDDGILQFETAPSASPQESGLLQQATTA
ncbi:NAD(P)/FAD-dependent oxidoreductase [Marinobacter sp. 2_MG-2023]|uniref:flavin-containing monooxygenase n=1 Tax=Marinobacter sp. 2_MG-2023 TaxID=3062679 RepID=UPI0026E20F7C|nr:NAD(P)/FAD-dependent oxidoreductase [Marinobacter sp. 2_MG-2023]MDO6442228.1 NAD(P)/FAD-dependent oxidoreductase [Marinobacter sp. 2_MG-2023]